MMYNEKGNCFMITVGNFQYQLGVKETKIALKIPFPRKPKKLMRQARKLDVREMDKVMSMGMGVKARVHHELESTRRSLASRFSNQHELLLHLNLTQLERAPNSKFHPIWLWQSLPTLLRWYSRPS